MSFRPSTSQATGATVPSAASLTSGFAQQRQAQPLPTSAWTAADDGGTALTHTSGVAHPACGAPSGGGGSAAADASAAPVAAIPTSAAERQEVNYLKRKLSIEMERGDALWAKFAQKVSELAVETETRAKLLALQAALEEGGAPAFANGTLWRPLLYLCARSCVLCMAGIDW